MAISIIVATHGDLAKGLLQSSFMIFGAQDNVLAVTFAANQGPEEFQINLQNAFNSFPKSDEVLIMVDLWGGSPFNQANILFERHKDRVIVCSGVNLPMLIAAYTERLNPDVNLRMAVVNIINEAKTGINALPEDLVQPSVLLQPQNNTKDVINNTIPEGTVLGDGKIKICLARIDSRLLHGQVATSWTKATSPDRIIIVSDSVSQDELRKQLIQKAAPPGVKAHVIPISKMIQISLDPRFGNTRALLLFETPSDALRVIEGGVPITEINIGSMAHSIGKTTINNVLSMDINDVQTFRKLQDLHVQFDVRKVPSDSRINLFELINSKF